jgi:DNA polymerase-1
VPPTLYLIDGHALAYRTYFALSSPRAFILLHAPVAYGRNLWFRLCINPMLEQNKPDYLAVAFDTGKTFRDEIYPAYKATRAKCRMIYARRLSAYARW